MSRLYIIHGWAYSIEPWASTVAALRQHGIDVVQLRVPGLTAPSDQPWTIDQYVAWLDEQLADDPEPIVLGHSNGGRIALHYLDQHPGRFRHLILLASSGLELHARRLSIKRRVIQTAAKIFAPLKRIPYIKRVIYRLLGGDYNAAPPHMRITLQHMLASDKDFSISHIQTPTSILWGEADRAAPLAIGQEMHAQLPHSTLRTFASWAHAPYRTHPDELASAIINEWEKIT
ncbi:hypothetical protein CR983_03915 [Candidatus Saccharibacteria bacterium]|nr:MAG: hypothetical protein CR983_03915 [Candidatus Saccharibacteria bacterium]